MATTNLKIDALDFDDIKNNLKLYLRSQNQFKDYDFEGSGLNILLDVLAYNTHYQSYYANMVANETFLDSALLDPSAISIAKHLNYVPKSYRSAVAYVDVELFLDETDPDDVPIIESIINKNKFILAGEQFSGEIGSETYLFSATKNFPISYENGSYVARAVEIKEGVDKSTTYVYDPNSNIDQKFLIPDLNVDTSSIIVRVSQSVTNNTGIETIWTQVSDINNLDTESKVYFLQQNADKLYEIYFGDGVIGQKPNAGNVISIFYKICNGSAGNGIGLNDTDTRRSFRYLERNASQTTLLKSAVDGKYSSSFGGSESETIQSVKYYAPRNYQAQERAVTAEDYRVVLAQQYGDQAEAIFVWGGEDNDPPVYGKVYVSVKPKNATKLTDLQKLAIAKNILKQKSIVSVIPEIVDPDYLYIVLDLNIKYNSAKTTLAKETLEQNIKNLIYAYGVENIGKFDQEFNESLFVSHVNDNYNPPVISCNIDLQLTKKFEPNLTTITNYTINFDNELYHPIDGFTPILSSSSFGYQDATSTDTPKPNVDVSMDDDGRGNIRIYKLVNGSKIYINETAGTIDYTTGKIKLPNFVPQYLNPETNTTISLTVIPKSNDISARRNQILLLNSEDITVTATPQTLRYDPYSASATAFRGTN
jgi:hypothetical protein